ncbi:DJ-1/PfpI family protein [Nisaea sp.]|uniref:DJ-1/PfpI family protein n=1 Tax=Nisaea sp. TaxID=2024842 RepID=UPI0032EB43E8
MQDKPLIGKNIAIMVANGFDEIEFVEPQKQLLAAGATVKAVSRATGLVNGWYDGSWGHFFPVDADLADTLAVDYAALIVPGGVRGVEKLAEDPHAQRVLKAFMRAGMPVALIGDATSLMITIEDAKGRTVTSSADAREALEAAGASWEDVASVTEGNLVTANGVGGIAEMVQSLSALITAFESAATEAA